ncbi:hypothetical protein AMTRI_Chr02g217850 [Amborella trichopoda]
MPIHSLQTQRQSISRLQLAATIISSVSRSCSTTTCNHTPSSQQSPSPSIAVTNHYSSALLFQPVTSCPSISSTPITTNHHSRSCLVPAIAATPSTTSPSTPMPSSATYSLPQNSAPRPFVFYTTTNNPLLSNLPPILTIRFLSLSPHCHHALFLSLRVPTTCPPPALSNCNHFRHLCCAILAINFCIISAPVLRLSPSTCCVRHYLSSYSS